MYARTLDCVHCGLCLPACPTYQTLGLETDSPRGRIYLIRALAEGRVEDQEVVRKHLDRCLDCRACETACPSGVQYGAILEEARSKIESHRTKPGLAAALTRFLLRQLIIRQKRLRTAFWLGRAAEVLGLRRLLSALRILPKSVDAIAPHVPPARDRQPLETGLHRPAGPVRGRVGLFTGCVMEQLFGHVNRATLDLLLANGFEVVVPHNQRCCGALLVHAGLPADARPLARANIEAFQDVDTVITNSAGCGCAMRDYEELLGDQAGAQFAKKCQDISAFLAAQGLTSTPAPRPGRAAYDDPCHLCHGQGVRQQPRQLLAQVPQLQLVEHESPEDCCGSAGIYNLVQPQIAADIGARKAANLEEANISLVVTGNPGCMLQISSHLRRIGSKAQVVHPVELLLPENSPQT